MHERGPVTRGHRSSWNQAWDLSYRESSSAMPRQGATREDFTENVRTTQEFRR
jgi:hypothetical protein